MPADSYDHFLVERSTDGVNFSTYATLTDFTTTQSTFTVPAKGAQVTINVVSSTWMTVNSRVNIMTKGHYRVVAKPTSNSVTLEYVDMSLNTHTAQSAISGLQVVPGSLDDTTIPSPKLVYRVTGVPVISPSFAFNDVQVVASGPDNDPPVVAITSPNSGATVAGTITITATVTDNVGVAKVQFYVDNLGAWVLLSEQTTSGPSYSQVLDTTTIASGAHNLLVRGYDLSGLNTYSLIGITVNNFNPDPGTMMRATDIAISPLSGEAQCTNCKTDSAGNVIVVGKFSGTINFSGTSLVSAGGYDIFVAKFNSSGTLQWVHRYGGIYDSLALGVAIDASDNIFVTGYFVDTLNLGGPSNLVSGGGNSGPDMFLVKYNSSGVWQWNKGFGGPNGNYANGVACDPTGNAYVICQYNGTISFGSGTPSLTSSGGTEGALVKFLADGSFSWARSFGGTGYDVTTGLAVNGSGEIFVSGYTTGNMTFGTLVRTSGGAADGFIAKYSTTGTPIWARLVGGLGNEAIAAVAADGAGGGVFAGSFTGNITIDGFSFSAPQSTAMMICWFNSSGVVTNARKVGGTSSIGGSVGPQVAAIDSSGNVVITGVATGEADFGSGQIGSGTGTIFLAKYKPTGVYLWDKRFGSQGWSIGLGLTIDASRNIYGAGSFSGTVNFDQFQLSSISNQIRDAYLFKCSP